MTLSVTGNGGGLMTEKYVVESGPAKGSTVTLAKWDCNFLTFNPQDGLLIVPAGHWSMCWNDIKCPIDSFNDDEIKDLREYLLTIGREVTESGDQT